MKIYIKFNDNKKNTIEVEKTNTIEDIKKKIFGIENNIPLDFQRLYFDGEELEDNKTLEDYEISEDDTILCEKKTDIDINIIYNDQYFTNIDEANLEDTIDFIKIQIEAKTYIPLSQQILYFEDKELEDNKTLLYYHFNKGLKEKTFYLFTENKNGILINIKRNSGENIKLLENEKHKIENIKQKIYEIKQFPIEYQCLIYDDKELVNYRTLVDYNISHNSTINLSFNSENGIIIFIKRPNEKLITLDVSKAETIYIIKRKIQLKENLLPQNYKLLLERTKLDDNNNLYNYEIKSETIFEYIFDAIGKYQIFIKTVSSRTISLDVDSWFTIEDIKELYYDREGIPSNQQRLIFNGIELEDNKTLDFYNIGKDSVINYEIKIKENDVKNFFN